jgi:hypothetical protein
VKIGNCVRLVPIDDCFFCSDDDPDARKARYEFKDGSIYEGVWKDAKMDGKGTFWSKNGSSFDGTFENGVLQGFAEAKWMCVFLFLYILCNN